ncbi:MAG: hypothetical protein RBG13Loki_3592 [Promethearchaeota archaeon CR_4]|nr:MAG: hypothetical protein RBG13Loki_3592 [Candidatus Lokiarchaeota archaeon CR_4]
MGGKGYAGDALDRLPGAREGEVLNRIIRRPVDCDVAIIVRSVTIPVDLNMPPNAIPELTECDKVGHVVVKQGSIRELEFYRRFVVWGI